MIETFAIFYFILIGVAFVLSLYLIFGGIYFMGVRFHTLTFYMGLIAVIVGIVTVIISGYFLWVLFFFI